MTASLHFKFTHNGATRRFALSRANEGLFDEVMDRVTSTVGTKQLNLFWKGPSKDVDSPSISRPCFPLDTPDDLKRAIEHIITYNEENKPPCLHLVVELVEDVAVAEQHQAVDAPAVASETVEASIQKDETVPAADGVDDSKEAEDSGEAEEAEEDYLDALERHLQAAADVISKEIRPLAEAAEVKLQAAVKSVRKVVDEGLEAALTVAKYGMKEFSEIFQQFNVHTEQPEQRRLTKSQKKLLVAYRETLQKQMSDYQHQLKKEVLEYQKYLKQIEADYKEAQWKELEDYQLKLQQQRTSFSCMDKMYEFIYQQSPTDLENILLVEGKKNLANLVKQQKSLMISYRASLMKLDKDKKKINREALLTQQKVLQKALDEYKEMLLNEN